MPKPGENINANKKVWEESEVDAWKSDEEKCNISEKISKMTFISGNSYNSA